MDAHKIRFIIIAVFLVCCSIPMLSCKREHDIPDREPLRIGEENKLEFSESVASLVVDEKTLTSTGTSFTIYNTSSVVFHTGIPYWVQTLVNGKWHDIKGLMNEFPVTAMEIRPGWSSVLVVDWSDNYGELPEGEYRLVKDIDLQGERLFTKGEFTLPPPSGH